MEKRKEYKKIDTVIFDLGGVLVDFHPIDGLRELGFSEQTVDAFKEKIFSGFWEECDSKVFTHEEIRKIYKDKLPGYEREVDQLWDHLPVVTGVRPYTTEWLHQLKADGLKLYVLSNFGNVSFEINSQTYDFLPLMDGMLISYELGITKPDRQIYEELCKRYDIDPAKAVFIDDRQINVDGAFAAGMQGLLFEAYEKTSSKLLKLIRNCNLMS